MPQPAPQGLENLPDLSHAIPAKDIGKLPSTAAQYNTLKSEIGREQPQVATAKARSEALKAQTEALRQKLIMTAARIQHLEMEKIALDGDIVRLSAQNKAMSASFVNDRVSVARLVAILERLEHDMPPAMAVRPDDALGAARGAMLIGASLPDVYGEAAALAHRIDALQQTRLALIARRADSVRNAAELKVARVNLDQLLATKTVDAREATAAYADLRAKLAAIAVQAADLQALLAKVAALRGEPAPPSIVVVTAQNTASAAALKRGSLRQPAVGSVIPAMPGEGAGIAFATPPGADVVAPADGKVLYAGPYHKSGHVLIFETTLGYDAVLAGLDRVYVRPEDQVLAGEPVGDMPKTERVERLYFELRQDGREIDPAPFLSLDLRKANRT